MTANNYVEEEILVLPHLTDGVMNLGDLWDCIRSKKSDDTLFTKKLTEDYIDFTLVGRDEKRAEHIKSVSDKLILTDIKGEMSLELMANIIKIKGSANFKQKDYEMSENFIYNYINKTHCLTVKKESKELIDKSVIEKINRKKLKATHFVYGITLGAELTAEITVSQSDKKNNNVVKGNGFVKLGIKKVNLSASATLDLIDQDKNENYKNEIKIYSAPALEGEANSIKELREEVKKINDIMKKNHFLSDCPNISGVAIRYELWPIEKFAVDVEIDRMYLKLKDHEFQEFETILIKMCDLRNPNYMMKKLIEELPEVFIILKDSCAVLSKSLMEYENKIKEIAINFLTKASEALQNYKLQTITVGQLLQIVRDFESSCSSGDIETKLNEFLDIARDELSFFPKLEDLDLLSSVKIITSESDLKKFENKKENVKIWLHYNDKLPNSVCQNFYELVPKLKNKEILIGIAVKSISPNLELRIDVKGETFVYTDHECLKYILGIIGATLEDGNMNEKLFHSMHSEMINIKLPFETIDDFSHINSFIEIMTPYKDVIISKDSITTLTILRKNDDKFKFFLPINAEQTSPQAMSKLSKHIKSLANENIEWIVGSLDIPQLVATAFLFIIKNSKVLAICLDELDMKLLNDTFKSESNEFSFLLAPKRMKHSFYPERAISAEKLMKHIEGGEHEILNINEYGLKHFTNSFGESSTQPCIHYKVLHNALKNLTDSEDDIIGIRNFLDQLIDTKFFNEVHWKEILKNNRIEFIIRSSMHDSRVKGKIYQMGCQSSIPEYMPPLDIAQDLKPYLYQENELQTFENFEQFKLTLDKIVKEKEIPVNFRTILLESFKENNVLYEKFVELGLLDLLQYDSNNGVFPEMIGIKTFSKIRNRILKYEFKEPDPEDLNHLYISFEDKTDFEINYKNYVEEKEIQIEPKLHQFNPQNYKESVVPFMIQKIKMWGCNALTPDKISKLMKKLDYPVNFNINDPFSNMVEAESDVGSPSIENSIMPLSRLDIIVGIFNSVDEIVAQDLLNNMAKFPQSLPLVINDLSEDDTYKVLMPWLTQTIKWELPEEKVLENHMFLDDFKMIVTLRIGDTFKGRNGKSTLINSVLKFQNVFSCCGEPRAINGKPSTLNGTVEYICLTKEISSVGLWQSFLESYYSSEKNQLLLLANLHGNSLDFTDTLLFLKSIATSFIVFIMPETLKGSKHDWNELIKIISSEPQNSNIFYIAVDPSSNCKYNENLILDSYKTADDNNLRKLRQVLKNAADFERKCFKITDLKIGGKLKLAEPIETLQSKNFMRFIENETWRSIKTSLYLQKINSWEDKSLIVSDINRIQKEIISLMRHMPLLEKPSRIKTMVHLDKELNRISTQETALARDRFIKLKKDVYLNEEGKAESEETLKFLINEACKEMDDNNFGSEHIYREIGKLFEFFSFKCLDNNPYYNSAKLYAELLIAGQALELLDGDSNSINDSWLSAICENINQIKPNLRIFVISILGLQSSGKSTLLNAVFGCKFAVSVGRCTRGLFIRLLFLDEIFRKEKNIDAILLIDTEGLASLEKINEKDAEKKDRSMATLAMGISHLTIVNVKGENMNNLTEILQIAIVAMTRLKIANISPDLIIVQHLDEFNDERLATARISFNETVKKSFDIINEKNVDLGVRNSDCLSQLKRTILSKEFFKSFHPLKNGSTINSPPSDEYHQDIVRLYCDILEIGKNNPNRTDFEKWSVLVQNCWDAVKKEDFMSFKGVMEIYEFLKKEKLISKVKDAIESAYSKHHDELKGFVAEKVKYLIDNNMNSKQALNELKNKLELVLDKCLSKCNECKTVSITRGELNEFVKLRSDKLDANKTIINYIDKIKISKTESLTMMLEGKMTREIQSADILEQINLQLKEQLKKKKEGEYCPEEIEELTHKICNDIKKQKAEQNKEIRVEDQIIDEIRFAYIMNKDFANEYENSPVNTLKDLKAFHRRLYKKAFDCVHKTNDHLNKNQVQILEKKAEKLSTTLLTEKNAEKFVPTMIQKLKELVINILEEFELEVGGNLRDDFKHKFHLFAIKKFEIDMKKKQKEWNEKNNPFTIFCDMESIFENLIRQRLTIGYGFNSEGILAGKSLVAAIKNKSMQTANSYKISKIKDIGWLTSVSTVRLKYFSELAEEVKNKNLRRTLTHFDIPQLSIEIWFQTVVDKYEIKDVFRKYKSTFEFELKKVITEVESYNNFTDLKEYIENYVSANDGINYMSNNELDFTREADNENLDRFRNRIVDVMNSCEERNLRETDLTFIRPSDEKSILEKLGCTASCPFCSALCWGTCDHNEDEGEGQMHHTSHQPMGLSGTAHISSLELNADPCHYRKHVKKWWHNGVEMTFTELKELPKYKNWFYEPHPQKEFNDLMKWFFFRLHNAIAERNNAKPALEKHINHYDFKSLDIVKIMAKINNKLGIRQTENALTLVT